MKPFLKQHLVAAVLLAATAGGALAQTTSSSIRGVVTGADGNPIAGSTVTIINESNGFRRTLETGDNGVFSIKGLPVNGDYTVVVAEEGYASTKAEAIVLNVGQTAELNFELSQANIEEVMVVASAMAGANVAVGPNATFGLETLQTAPAINRNISDVLRSDPRIYVDEVSGNAISCGGQNPRFNSLTVDGVRMNDSFGLNDNGYPTERMPFSFDAIEQVAVEIAPFDVIYGGFTGCNINAVTKAGANEFYGSIFMDYTDDSLKGDSLEGEDVIQPDADETRFGFTVGGPIIQDKLFFFAAYEKLEGVNTFDRGALGSNAIDEVNITQAEVDEIAAIANTLYGYDPGTIPTGFDNEDEKLLIKLDWNISDNHRASFTYNYNDGFNITESDGDSNELEFSNHLYERGAELNSYVGAWYGNWTDSFSTEVRISYLDLDNRQNSIGGTDFGEIRVETDDVDVYLGGDDSRQSNLLEYENTAFSFRGFYDMGQHQLTFGVEREELDVYNLFVQHSETEIRFDSIDDFRDGLASAIYYNNAPSQNPEDAAADWAYEINTVFVQDDFDLGNGVALVFGLRYDWYTTGDEPVENTDFTESYGFANNATLDGEGLLQPRFGFTWDATDTIAVRGGFGLFSGGNPNVWLSNNYSNNNVLQFGQRGRDFGYTDGTRSLFDDDIVWQGAESGVPASAGYAIPGELYDAVAAGTGSNFEINYLDPDFELPSEWKFALGATWELGEGYVLDSDLLLSRGENTAMVLRGDLEQVGTTDEGRPIYDSVRDSSFVLTNSDKGNQSLVWSISMFKAYDFGLNWTVGYAYSDAEEVQPMTSAVAFSNYQNRSFFDPQEDVVATSYYNIRHRFTFTTNFTRTFWGNNETRISLYGSANSGRPYSDTLAGSPNDVYGFNPFLEGNPILASAGDRNDNEGSWWAKLDLKIEQEFGGFGETDKLSAFMVVDNLTNLLNDEWGIQREADFPGNVAAGEDEETRIGDTSLYEIRFGVNYVF